MKRRTVIIIVLVIILLVIVVIPTFNYFVLQRPIKADADDVVMQPEQMPTNWTFISDTLLSLLRRAGGVRVPRHMAGAELL